MNKTTLTRKELYRLAASADCDVRTAEKWLSGREVLPALATVLLAATKRLGLKIVLPAKGATK